jgi:cytoskeletal protein CcmA (bactofilin family)
VLPVGAATVALLSLLGAASAGSAEKAARIEVGPHGVVVERDGEGDSTDTARIRIGADVDSEGLVSIDESGAGIVRVFADAAVPAGQRILGDVVAVFGSVDVAGQVDGDVVAVMGSVRLREGAAVDGDVVAIGGRLDQAPGVVVNGESVSLGFFPFPWGLPALPVMLAVILTGWLITLFLAWVFAALFRTRLAHVASMASKRTVASFFLGLLSLPGFVALVVLLFVTVIGIPLALGLPVAFTLLQYAGQIAGTYVLGCRLTGRALGTGSGVMAPLIAGTGFVALFFVVGAVLAVMPGVARPLALFFCLLGVLLILGLTQIGTGAFLLSRFGAAPRSAGASGEGLGPAAQAPLAAPPTA